MIYASIVRRYILPYIFYSVLAAIAVAVSIWCFDGIVAYASFLAFIVLLVGLIPFLVYRDYREVKDYIVELNEMRKGGPVPASIVEKTVALAAEKTGVPEFIIDYFAAKALAAIKL